MNRKARNRRKLAIKAFVAMGNAILNPRAVEFEPRVLNLLRHQSLIEVSRRQMIVEDAKIAVENAQAALPGCNQ